MIDPESYPTRADLTGVELIVSALLPMRGLDEGDKEFVHHWCQPSPGVVLVSAELLGLLEVQYG